MNKTYIIAEAGVNHNGSESLAMDMVTIAKEMGADAIKFQLFKAGSLVTTSAEQAQYQKKTSEQQKTQYQMLKELELPNDSFKKLQAHALKEEIDFIITPFDLESLQFIVQDLALQVVKIGSGDVTNGPLLLAAARSQKEIILSTGMCTLSDIEKALKVITFGYLAKEEFPTAQSLEDYYLSSSAQSILEEKVTLLHCTSEYPAPVEEVNLKAMDTIFAAFGLPVGLSDHTQGIGIAIAAVAREAIMIEKHFTLDNEMVGPDHRASLNPVEFRAMISGIRQVEKALGDGRKCPTLSETKNADVVRRSLVANQNIASGETFTEGNIGIKRPSNGISPMAYWDFLGKKANKNFTKDEMLA